jgi:hypothetical protein
MSYYPLNPHPNTPDPVKIFLRDHVDMQFHDVHIMLRLPLPAQGLDAGCNFAAAHVLLALISGVAMVLFYKKNDDFGKPVTSGSGARFKEVLKQYYPWDDALRIPHPSSIPVTMQERIDVLYDLLRNPLAHELGVISSTHHRKLKIYNTIIDRIYIDKHEPPLTEEQIEQIELSPTRPHNVRDLIIPQFPDKDGKNTVHIVVHTLYWGVRHLVENLTAQPTLMAHAVQYLSS